MRVKRNGTMGVLLVIVLIVALIFALIPYLFPPSITVASARDYLEDRGYIVYSICLSDDFLPCDNDTHSLGSEEYQWKKLWVGGGSIHLGNVELSNFEQQLDIDGQLVMHDEGKVWMEIQPDLDYAIVTANGKPTQVYRGVHSGFSLPVYNDDSEELFVAMDVPREWDGITDPVVHIHCYVPNTGDGFWVSPSSSDNGSEWFDDSLAYDGDKKTYAYNPVVPTSWSAFVEFTIDTDNYDNVRFYAKYDIDNINTIDIDAYHSGAWRDIYEGSYASMEWIEKSLGGTYEITNYRIRFYNAGLGAKDARLYETSLDKVSGQGNFNFELGYGSFTVTENDEVSDNVSVISLETASIAGNYVSYQVDITLPTGDMTTCDQMSLRLRRVEASECEISEEIIVTHIGIQFLRNKLGTTAPN